MFVFCCVLPASNKSRDDDEYTNDQVGSCVLVDRHNVSDAVDTKLPWVVSIVAVAQVQAVQDLQGVR